MFKFFVKYVHIRLWRFCAKQMYYYANYTNLWSTIYLKHKLNSLKNKFRKFLRFKTTGSLNGLYLSDRWIQTDVSLMLVNEIINIPQLLELLNFVTSQLIWGLKKYFQFYFTESIMVTQPSYYYNNLTN